MGLRVRSLLLLPALMACQTDDGGITGHCTSFTVLDQGGYRSELTEVFRPDGQPTFVLNETYGPEEDLAYGQAIRYHYAEGRLERIRERIASPDEEVVRETAYRYDSDLNVRRIVETLDDQPSQTSSLTYDEEGRLVATVFDVVDGIDQVVTRTWEGSRQTRLENRTDQGTVLVEERVYPAPEPSLDVDITTRLHGAESTQQLRYDGELLVHEHTSSALDFTDVDYTYTSEGWLETIVSSSSDRPFREIETLSYDDEGHRIARTVGSDEDGDGNIDTEMFSQEWAWDCD